MSVGKLYIHYISPPCRAVLWIVKVLGVEMDIVSVNIFTGENFTPEFLKMNPQHTVPTYLDNDGTAIGDSHAIMAYLVGKYGKTDSLYPKDLAKRAVIDQRLHFDSGKVFSLHFSIVMPMWTREIDAGVSTKQLAAAEEMYSILNAFLQGNFWVAGGDCASIADFSLVTSITAFSILVPFDSKKYPNIVNWIKRCQALPCYHETNHKEMEEYRQILIDMMNNKYDIMEKFYN